ncbi:hypothetical protein NC651_026240 [Populus alba x Populus x berolinensis]|nr:hypothetical protein NC651_026240 [Populus alba x Populus x berolinensis]
MVFFGYGAKGMEAVLALYMRILLFFLLQTLFWIPFTLLLWVAFVLLPSLPLARFLHGAMAVSVHSGMYHRELFPRLVEGSWDGKTRHISTTGMHSSAITDSEWCWQRRGRFGIGEVRMRRSFMEQYHALIFSRTTYELSTENFAFVRLETKDGTPAVVMWSHASRIAGGGYHCLALTGKVTPERHGYSSNCNSHEGQVLSWGFDGHGQLGHSSIQCQKIPAVIDVLADQHVIHVTCGGSSLAAITGLVDLEWTRGAKQGLFLVRLAILQSFPSGTMMVLNFIAVLAQMQATHAIISWQKSIMRMIPISMEVLYRWKDNENRILEKETYE